MNPLLAMTDAAWGYMWSGLPATLIALATLIKVWKVHKELNSRLSEWKDETKQAALAATVAAKAEGVKEEKEKHS